jgi:hypothetical protein
MTMLSRMLLCALAVTGLLFAVFSLRPDWAEAAGLDLGRVPALAAQVESEQEREADLVAQLAEVKQRVLNKQQVTDDVIAGRLDLFAAAAQFRELTPAAIRERHYMQLVYPDACDEERYCRSVIGWVRGTLQLRSPPEADRVASRLEADLREHLAATDRHPGP